MKIALLGFGNMGKEIDRLISQSSAHQVVSKSLQQINGESDVVIDFTSAEVVLSNIRKVASLGKNIVVGTTGWYEQIKEVKKIVDENNIGLIYAQNFSIGANVFFRMVALVSSLVSKFGDYDVYGFEVHHKGKLDSPSGTALRIAREILDKFPAKKRIQTDKVNGRISADQLHFASIRGGRNPGFHQVVFDSLADSITLSHQAHNRSGFAQGAILAAEFIKGKKGFYNFDQLFEEEVKQ